MKNKAAASNCRYPQDHSDKSCVCGGHNDRNWKRHKRKPSRESIRKGSPR